MAFVSEFRKFITRGNVIDLAVGVIIGAAFNKIVTSFIEDIVTPLLLNPLLDAAQVRKLEDYTWHSAKPGMFISAMITFLLTALVLFLMIRGVNRFRERSTKTEAEKPPAPSMTEQLLGEIRDELRARPR